MYTKDHRGISWNCKTLHTLIQVVSRKIYRTAYLKSLDKSTHLDAKTKQNKKRLKWVKEKAWHCQAFFSFFLIVFSKHQNRIYARPFEASGRKSSASRHTLINPWEVPFASSTERNRKCTRELPVDLNGSYAGELLWWLSSMEQIWALSFTFQEGHCWVWHGPQTLTCSPRIITQKNWFLIVLKQRRNCSNNVPSEHLSYPKFSAWRHWKHLWQKERQPDHKIHFRSEPNMAREFVYTLLAASHMWAKTATSHF